jgi:inner membrane protein
MKIFLKLTVLGVISILLLIALISIGGVMRERKSRLHTVQADMARSYAESQQLIGPVLTITYRETWIEKTYSKEQNGWVEQETSTIRSANFYPDQLSYDGSLQAQERYRGIFKAQVFQTEGTLAGTLRFPAVDALHAQKKSAIDVLSVDANLCISDPRGISQVPQLQWNGELLDILPGSSVRNYADGIHAVIPYTPAMAGQKISFSMDLKIHGTGQFQLVPIGSSNRISLSSSWPHPSFIGDFLATERTVSDGGFTAEWNVNALACSAQQSLNNTKSSSVQSLGINLIDPVTSYSQTDRALKYGFLFIFLTFAAFFLFEVIRQLQIHPIQYGFVGLAQALFFLLLLSLSEHIGFGIAYLIATAATIGVIATYLCSVLKGLKRGLLFGGLLGFLYAALFGLLKSEDHALVAGSALLFGLMACVMILTRNIDWYALTKKGTKS